MPLSMTFKFFLLFLWPLFQFVFVFLTTHFRNVGPVSFFIFILFNR